MRPRRLAAPPVAARRGLVADAHEGEAAVVGDVRLRVEGAAAPHVAAEVAQLHLRHRRGRHNDQHDGADGRTRTRSGLCPSISEPHVPSLVPFTVPCVSHSSEARNSSRRFFSHIALCDEHARSMNIFCGVPMSVKSSRTRSGGTCLSCCPTTISVGACTFPTIAAFQPQVAVCGARRTPGPTSRRPDPTPASPTRPRRRPPARTGRAADLAIPVGREVFARLRVHRGAVRRILRRRGRRRGAVVGGREQHELAHLLRILRREAAGARAAERPRQQADFLHPAQRADVVDHRADVVPVGGDCRHRVRVARRARGLHYERRLPILARLQGSFIAAGRIERP